MRAHGTPDAVWPDPSRAASKEDLGRELTAARERAGLTIREAARAAGIPASTAGDYFAGRHLPSASQPQILMKLLSACGITGPDAEPWVRALSRVRRSPGRRAGGTLAPYRGLAAFGTEDSEWFFGRDDLADLLARLAADGPAGTPIAVTGPSGSGKSSLLQAGLIPRLSASAPTGQPPSVPVLLTPGADPVGALAGRGPGRQARARSPRSSWSISSRRCSPPASERNSGSSSSPRCASCPERCS